MARTHARVAAGQVDVLSKPALELIRRIDQNPNLSEELDTGDLFKLAVATSWAMPSLANMERVSRADPQVEAIPTFVTTHITDRGAS